MDLKTGSEVWCFHTCGEEWYGPYGVSGIELRTCILEEWMKWPNYEDTYFKSKQEAIGAMIKRLEELREE